MVASSLIFSSHSVEEVQSSLFRRSRSIPRDRYITRSVQRTRIHTRTTSFSIRSSSDAARRAAPSAADAAARRRDAVNRQDYRGLFVDNPGYWDNSERHEAYPIPPIGDPLWATLRAVRPRALGGCVRVLQSANTQGYITYTVDDTGLARVTDWTYVPDLLLWNPIEYFLRHPHINEVWCETTDTTDYTASSAATDPTGIHTVGSRSSRSVSTADANASVGAASSHSASSRSLHSASGSSDAADADDADDPPNYALVIKRSEMSYALMVFLRDQQYHFFDSHRMPLPPLRDFSANLHGR